LTAIEFQTRNRLMSERFKVRRLKLITGGREPSAIKKATSVNMEATLGLGGGESARTILVNL
jgi:hypothetical protein